MKACCFPSAQQPAKSRETIETIYSAQYDPVSNSTAVVEDQLGDYEGSFKESQHQITVI